MKVGDCLTSKGAAVDNHTVPLLVKMKLPGDATSSVHRSGPERRILHGIHGFDVERGNDENMRRRLGADITYHQNVSVPKDYIARNGPFNHSAKETRHTLLIPSEFRKGHSIPDPHSLQ